MKKQTIIILAILTLSILMCAFTFESTSSVKTLTKPYINTYECTAAKLGEENLMEKYEYIKITFLNDDELEVSLKRKNGKKRAYVCPYTYDEESGALSAEIGILGFKFKQDTIIRNGKFTLCMSILGKTLLMNFAA